MEIRPLTATDRCWVHELLVREWHGPLIVTRGHLHQADRLPGLIAWEDGERCGCLTYHGNQGEYEIVTLNSLVAHRGIGSALLSAFISRARTEGVKRVWLVTTNDNQRAIAFYQARGFTCTAVYRNAIAASRRLKADIPLYGCNGIPITDEIEMSMTPAQMK